MRRRIAILCMIFLGLLASFSISAGAFMIATKSFHDQGTLPVVYTCDDQNISPELFWKNPPEKTQSFALIVADPDAPGGTWYHRALYNIPKNTKTFPQNIHSLPQGTMTALNSWGQTKYNGPCPPKGSAHHYIFTLYALDTLLNLPSNANAADMMGAMKNHVLEQTQLTAKYSRWNN